jgi:parallel beta-helix repeat protein
MKAIMIIRTTALILALITVFTTTAAAISCDCGDICVNETGWWNDGGAFNASTTPIQAAVNAASGGETICVKAGSYTENVNIATAHLTLAGEGAGVVTVTAASPSYPVFDVAADYVNISGFTVTGVIAGYVAGIYLIGADHCNISENNASNNCDGILLEYSSNNTLTSNTANSNDRDGIWLEYSSNNTLTGNTMSGNVYNFGVRGSSLSEYTQNMDTSNTVDGRPIYYWVDQKDRKIPRNAGFVGVVNGTNITVGDLTLTNNSQGALFAYTENSRIENVTANSNDDLGIYLYSSSNNTLTNNTANSNNGGGIWLEDSSNNNTLTDNDVAYNSCGIGLSSSSNNALTNNTVNSNDDPGIHLYSSSNYNTLTDNDVSYNGGGIWLEYSGNNALTSNTASNNGVGIVMSSSSNNNITCNWVHGNEWGGFDLIGGSTDNNISYNNIIIAGVYAYQFRNDQPDDVNAINNWWGTTDNDIINASIFDWQDDPNKGTVTYLPKLDSPSPCAPIPELPTAILLAVGLLMLAGYVRVGRKA